MQKHCSEFFPFFIFLAQEKGRMTENKNYYEQTVGNAALKGFTVPV